ncbi:hypothetical protein C8R46DRAFT_1025857 [Mycena filopes]|nr:hypothetical protein C8R46DRAFT_1025857 [Mycena filopes]
MSFPQLFDAYSIIPTYVPFKTLQAVSIDPVAQAASFAYAKRLSSPAVFAHVLRCFYFALSLLYSGFPSGTPGAAQISFQELSLRTYHARLAVCAHVVRCFYFALALLYSGFPSGTPGVAQIGFEELSLRLYHTTLLHDLGWSNATEVVTHPAHAMTFELHGAFMAYAHLHAASPNLDVYQVGDIVESIVLHTSQWSSGNSSATQILMMLSATFDIEAAYPRGEFYNAATAVFDEEFARKPNCLLSHYPGGLAALEKDLRVGPIVPEIQPVTAPHALLRRVLTCSNSAMSCHY